MPAGRPSKYEPEFCAIAEQQMGLGFSKTATAGHLGVCKTTFDNWCAEHPEFMGAVKRGEAGRTLKLETDLLSAPDGPTVTSRIFALKNAAPDEWRDKREVANTHDLADPMAEFFAKVADASKRIGQ
jgi:hypothetical protein